MQYGLIAVMNNRQLDQRNAALAAQREGVPAPGPYDHLVGRLASYIDTCWEQNRSAKSTVERDMLEDLRQRQGEYSPDKLAAIREQGGSEIYMMLTNMKCRALEGWLRDVLMPTGERPFAVDSTPVPDLPPDVMQQIAQHIAMEAEQAIASGLLITPAEVYERARAVGEQLKQRLREEVQMRNKRMEDKIDDLLVEGQWYDAMNDFIGDLVTYPAAFIKGPVIRKKRRLKWGQDPMSGKWVPMADDELVPVYYSPSPLDMYPAPDARSLMDGPLFERIPLRRSALHKMIGVPGYKEEAIRAVLDEYSKGFNLMVSIDQQRRDLENSSNWQLAGDHAMDGLEFHAEVPGAWLIEWGMDAARVPDPAAEYAITALKIGRYVVRCVLNEDPLGRRPYESTSFDRIKGQVWGRGVPRILRDLQDMCNAAARSLVNNMGLSSGPIMEVEANRLAEGEDVTQLYPWRIIQTKSSNTTPAPAVRFHNVPSNARELVAVYQFFAGLADQYSGIQTYDTGVNPTSGAASTASGLSMLISASSRQIKHVVAGIDRCTQGTVSRTHEHVMLHDPDESIKGDTRIVARGAGSLIAKEQQQMRKTEFLAATANPIDSQIIGPDGRAELLREVVKSFDMNPDKIVPSRDQLIQRMRQAMLSVVPSNPQAPAAGGAMPRPRSANAAGQPAGGVDAALFQNAA